MKQVKQITLYSVGKSGASINTNKDEIERFCGIQMLMSIVKMPRYDMYWSQEIQYEPISSTLSLKQYKKICRILHVIDDLEEDKQQNENKKVTSTLQ